MLETATLGTDSKSIRVLLVSSNDEQSQRIRNPISSETSSPFEHTVVLERVRRLSDALEMVSRTRFDAIVLDLQLSDSQGIKTLRRLMLHGPRAPVVVITEDTDPQMAIDALAEGAEDLVYRSDLKRHRLLRTLYCSVARHRREIKSKIIESANAALVIVETSSPKYPVIYANRACERLLGYCEATWQRIGLWLLDREDLEGAATIDALKAPIESGQPNRLKQCIRRKDGTSLWCQIDALPVSINEEQMTHVVYFLRDITESIDGQIGNAERSQRAILQRVANGIAHEINNPLSFIAGNLEFALRSLKNEIGGLDTALESSSIEALKDTMVGCRRVEDVVRGLTQLAGISATADYPVEELPIVEPLNEALNMIGEELAKQIRLDAEIDPDLIVRANRVKLREVFLHLLRNASEAFGDTNHQGDEICVRAFAAGKKATITIEDNGLGIDSDTMRQISEPFFTTRTSSRNNGLGLSIASAIIHQFRGTVDVDSVSGEGTQISISLPRAKTEVAPEHA